MKTPILHHVPAARGFRILWLLHEMGIKPDLKLYRISDGSLRDPDFLGVSPAGRVPALEIDGTTIYESGAITEYLCETRAEHGLGRAPGDPERIPFLEALHFAETQACILANLNLQWIFLRPVEARSPALLKIEAARLAATLKPLERLLGDREFILESGFSGADTMLGYNLMAAPYFVRFDKFPNLRAYWDRMQARPAFQAAKEQDGPQEFYTQDFYEVSQ